MVTGAAGLCLLAVSFCVVRGGLQHSHVHPMLDTLAELRGAELHPLAELAGQHVGLTLGRIAQRPHVVRVREHRDGGQRHHRQQEERDDQSKS